MKPQYFYAVEKILQESIGLCFLYGDQYKAGDVQKITARALEEIVGLCRQHTELQEVLSKRLAVGVMYGAIVDDNKDPKTVYKELVEFYDSEIKRLQGDKA